MSKIFRTKGWLTIAQLAESWARELVETGEDTLHCQHDLTHELVEDILNGKFDMTGPFYGGQCSGIVLITPENKAAIIDEGQRLTQLAAADPNFFVHNVVLMKEAVLDFAKRRQLPQPRWWSDAGEHATAGTKEGQGKPKQKSAPRNAGKQDRISIYLAEKYPHGVPGPAIVPRKHLKNQLLAQDPTLRPLDEATLKSAIDRYNDRVPTQNDDPN